MKCINCDSEIEEVVEEESGEFYICSEGHRNPRMIDHQGYKKTIQDDEIIHHTVAMIIENNDEILLLKRRKYPFKLSIPAGHLEEGEKPEKAAVREVREETNIADINISKKIFEGTIKDKCRRGADKHYWHLYYSKLEERPDVKGNDESEYLTWENQPLQEELTDVVRRILSGEISGLKPWQKIE